MPLDVPRIIWLPSGDNCIFRRSPSPSEVSLVRRFAFSTEMTDETSGTIGAGSSGRVGARVGVGVGINVSVGVGVSEGKRVGSMAVVLDSSGVFVDVCVAKSVGLEVRLAGVEEQAFMINIGIIRSGGMILCQNIFLKTCDLLNGFTSTSRTCNDD